MTAGPLEKEKTAILLQAVRAGDREARDVLIARYLPILQRWAHGRLPQYARHSAETDDLVQVCLIRALKHIEGFEQTREGAFLAYLRQILLNAIRDEIRKSSRRPESDLVAADEALPSLVERSVGRETIMAYEAALAQLPHEHKEAVILRVEFGYSYPEIAAAMNKPTANAARMFVSRALVQLAESMGGQP